jgi:hypothetical protein
MPLEAAEKNHAGVDQVLTRSLHRRFGGVILQAKKKVGKLEVTTPFTNSNMFFLNRLAGAHGPATIGI